MTTFTKQQLFQVRNEIDIDVLITDKLNLERQFNGLWRFQCPLCHQFNTATQKKTNLSRCFNCQQNFNTIDLVIYAKKMNFVPAVQWLLSLLENKTPAARISQKTKKMADHRDEKSWIENRTKGRLEIEKIKQMIQ